LGLHKTPVQYGAFPMEPYSHTTRFSGVQQPGMTGQVKEDIITRFIELGVRVENGIISFNPALLKKSEFISADRTWRYCIDGTNPPEQLPSGSLAFSVCGVPVIYRLAEVDGIQLFTEDAAALEIPGNALDFAWSQSLFRRDKRISKLIVHLSPNGLR